MNPDNDTPADDKISLEPAPPTTFHPTHDPRTRLDEPLPVRLLAVADVRATARTGTEPDLHRFYVGLWGFAPAPPDPDPDDAQLAFQADNFRLLFQLQEGLVEHPDLRPIPLEVPSLPEAEQKLIAAELEYERHRGLQPGSPSLLTQDPAGNYVELTERHELT